MELSTQERNGYLEVKLLVKKYGVGRVHLFWSEEGVTCKKGWVENDSLVPGENLNEVNVCNYVSIKQAQLHTVLWP